MDLHAHLYGLSRDDFAYILTTFPVLQKNEERKYNEYRTARLALAAYDALTPMMAKVGIGARCTCMVGKIAVRQLTTDAGAR